MTQTVKLKWKQKIQKIIYIKTTTQHDTGESLASSPRTGVVPNSDSLPGSDSPRVHAHDVIECRQLRKQTDIRRRK